MKIEYHNLYTHFILITQNRTRIIQEKNRDRIEKYIAGVVNNSYSKLYSIYANPEHIHLLVSRSPRLSEEGLATIVADSSSKFINDNKFNPRTICVARISISFFVSKSVSFAEEYDEFVKYYQKTLKWEISQ